MQDFQTQRFSPYTQEDQTELQLMQETHLLLENLAEREKVTVKAILDGLYDVGSVRLINQKVTIKVLRGPLKGIARMSKPAFRIFAWRWFKKNCPELITDWLFKQVQFGDRPSELTPHDANLIDVAPVPEALPPQTLPPILERQAEEILALRGRVSVLTATVVILALVVCFNVLT